MLVFFVAVVVLISMLVFIAVNVLYFKEKFADIKNVGIGFVMINAMAAGGMGVIPVC